MTMDQPTTKFESWAVVELFGHQREAGFVSTQYFGDKCMFQIDVPKIEEHEFELKRPSWETGELIPAGSKVKKEAKEGRTRLVSPGAVYAINPCSEAMCNAALEELTPRAIKVVELAKEKQIGIGDNPVCEPFDVYEIEGEGFFFNDAAGRKYGSYDTHEFAEAAADRISESLQEELLP